MTARKNLITNRDEQTAVEPSVSIQNLAVLLPGNSARNSTTITMT